MACFMAIDIRLGLCSISDWNSKFWYRRLDPSQKRAALGFTFAGAGFGAVIGSLLISAFTAGSTLAPGS